MARPSPLCFEDFRKVLADLLDVDVVHITPQAYFVPDLGVDSIRLFQAILKLEKMGLELSLDSIGRIETVGDAYGYYQKQARGAGG